MCTFTLIIFILFLFIFCVCDTLVSSFEKKGRSEILLSSTITNHFRNCDLFLIEDNKNESVILNFLANITSTLNPKLSLGLSSFHKNTSSSFLTLVPRKHNQCSVIITLLANGIQNLNTFNKLLTSGLHSPTKPNTDHYIFIAPSTSLNLIMLHSKILEKIRFKIFIKWPIEVLSAQTCYTVCIFCSDNKIKTVNLTESIPISQIFPDWTKNGLGHPLRISSPTKYHYIVELSKEPNQWKCKRGQIKFVIESLLPHYNFTYIIFPSSTNDSGKFLPSGQWTGVMGDLLNRKADLGLSTSYNYQRYAVVGFSRGTDYAWGTFILGQPKISYSWQAIFWAFKVDLWVAIGIALTAVILAFRVLRKLIVFNLSASNIAFALIGKEVPYPKSNPARILLSIWLFACLVLGSLYVSKMVEVLAFPVLQPQPKNFEELVNPKFGYKWGIVGGGNLFAHFESSTNPTFKTVHENMGKPQQALDCFKKAIISKFACITWKGSSDYISYKNLTFSHGKSPIVTMDQEEKTLFVPVGFAMQRNSILLPNFNLVIQTIVDSGQGEKWVDMDYQNLQKGKVQWQKENGTFGVMGAGNDIDDRKDLSINNLIGVFYIFAFGMATALVGFTFEFMSTMHPLKI